MKLRQYQNKPVRLLYKTSHGVSHVQEVQFGKHGWVPVGSITHVDTSEVLMIPKGKKRP